MPNVRDIEGSIWVEILVRALLALLFIELEGATPFTRKIQPDELWLYKNPRSDSYIPTSILWPLVFITPTVVFLLVFLLQKDKVDISQAILGCSLGLSLNGVFTNIIKLIVGRPRPDFFWRCFPDGKINAELRCTGDESVIIEGRKSFPSGHSSFSFVSMGFVAFYLAGKLHIFNSVGRGKSWRLCSFLLPLSIALVVALSRTCDYHHHWQDVLCGSLLGLSISYLCYRQYYPSLTSVHSHRPYASITPHLELEAVRSVDEFSTLERTERHLRKTDEATDNQKFERLVAFMSIAHFISRRRRKRSSSIVPLRESPKRYNGYYSSFSADEVSSAHESYKVLLYGSEIWTMKQEDRNRLRSTEMKFSCKSDYTLFGHKRNEEILEELKVESTENKIQNYEERLFQHVSRTNNSGMPR